MLSFRQFDTLQTMGDSDAELVTVQVPPLLVGSPVSSLTVLGEIQVVSVERGSRAFIPTAGTILHDEDVLCLAVTKASRAHLRSILGKG